MVQCAIVGCSSRTLIVSLFKMKSFARNRSSEFRRKNLPNIQHCHICSDHFEPSCFEGVLATAIDAIIACTASNLCFLYSGDFSGKPSAGEVNRKVVFASNWGTSFRE